MTYFCFLILCDDSSLPNHGSGSNPFTLKFNNKHSKTVFKFRERDLVIDLFKDIFGFILKFLALGWYKIFKVNLGINVSSLLNQLLLHIDLVQFDVYHFNIF